MGFSEMHWIIDRNISAQHITTLLAATSMLRVFAHPVAKCCDMLSIAGKSN